MMPATTASTQSAAAREGGAMRLRVLISALVFVFAACTTSAPASPTDTSIASPTVPSTPTAPAPTATSKPTQPPAKTIADLLAAPTSAATASSVTPSNKAAAQSFASSCAKANAKLPAAESALDRDLGCFVAIAEEYKAYRGCGPACGSFANVESMYSFAVGALGPVGTSWLNGALTKFDSDLAATPLNGLATGIKSITDIAKIPVRSVNLVAAHQAQRDAYGQVFGAILTSRCPVIGGSWNYCAVGAGGVPGAIATPVAACELAPRVPGYNPNSTEQACTQGPVEGIWATYRITGQSAFFDLAVIFRNILAAKGAGARLANEYMTTTDCMVSGLFTQAGLLPGTPGSCAD
jgi:hypothetical protein